MAKNFRQGVKPTESDFLVKDLATCLVYTETGECLGQLVDVLPAGGNDVWVVQKDQQEILIPAKRDVVLRVDLEAKRIDVQLPTGLRAIYDPPAAD